MKNFRRFKELNIDKNKLYFLQTKEYDNENDNSNVIYTELNGYKFMFMGDASVEVEEDLLFNDISGAYLKPEMGVLTGATLDSRKAAVLDAVGESIEWHNLPSYKDFYEYYKEQTKDNPNDIIANSINFLTKVDLPVLTAPTTPK